MFVENDDELMRLADQMVRERYADMPEIHRARIAEKLASELEKVVNEAVILSLPEECGAKLDAWMEKERPSAEELEQIIAESGLNTEEIARRAILDYREDFLKGVDDAQQ